MTALTRLGLRAGEVAALALDDLDWRAGTLRIKGKGGRVDRLPLPADVGRRSRSTSATASDLTMKERALARRSPLKTQVGRYRPGDALPALLESL